MNFATLQGLTIPEGAVTQIADASGRVLWMLSGGDVILEVEKITSDTYAGETTYTGEQFILLNIYPKTNGTVSVTYGGLTKTITDTSGVAEPNAQQVYFGTFNGVSDSVATPASGELTIEGDYYAFGVCSYTKNSKDIFPPVAYVINAVVSFGSVTKIPDAAFSNISETGIASPNLTTVKIPSSVKSIGLSAFSRCKNLKTVILPNGLRSIMTSAFSHTALTEFTIPPSVVLIESNPVIGVADNNIIRVEDGNTAYKIDGNCLVEIATNKIISGFANSVMPTYITEIGTSAFSDQSGLTDITIPSGVTKIGGNAFFKCTGLTNVTLLSTTPPTLGNTAVFTDTTCSFTVPKGCGEAYKAAEGWRVYADNIVEAS